MKRCCVAYAMPDRQYLWAVEVAPGASVAQVLAAAQELARALGEDAQVPWDGDALGIFGEPCRRTDLPRDGDRVEIYRPLIHDPRAGRRARLRGR